VADRPTDAYAKFIEITGLKVSPGTFNRMRRELLSGDSNRLNNLVNRKLTPAHEKKSFRKHANPDEVPFLAYDGEGTTLEGKHKYVLLANRNRDGSIAESVYKVNGLSTVDCLDFLLDSAKFRYIRIFYSFGYDVQQMLVDLSDEQLVNVMHGKPTKYKSYTIHYLPGKIFTVNNVRFYDVFNYWQTSFIKAITQTLGPDAISADLVRGKESRSEFASWNINDILRYTNEELDLLVKLAEHLREVLLRCNIHLGSAYYGPGSIANYWFKKHSISPPQITDPTLVDVMERGYYGGRFETFVLGKVEPIYECDINSAYPAIIAGLPYLDRWERWSGGLFDRSSTYSIWHISWKLPSDTKIGPFPSRDKHGLISYPANGIGWYWKPEIEAALAIYGSASFNLIEGYHPSVIEGEPFAWVVDIYQERLELKGRNDPAQWALKVGLNSLYGKTAQRVGSAKYFSLAWAGYITSATRAKLLLAINGRTASVIAFATDAVYFNRNPKIANSTILGGWSAKRWNRGYFIQSGVYRLENTVEHKDAYRGFSVKNGIQDLIDQIKANPFKHPSIYQIKFVGHLEAIRAPEKLGPHRLCFITMRKKLQPFRTTKRRVIDDRVYTILQVFNDDEDDSIYLARGSDYTRATLDVSGRKYPAVVWNYYETLLKSQVETIILVNHNDHRGIDNKPDDLGELEESYPFMRLTDRADDIGLSDAEDIAEERIGGASGLINLRNISNLPIVDEEEVIKELSR
jgi:hypothetical protein